jgi:predicted transcriptional regulator
MNGLRKYCTGCESLKPGAKARTGAEVMEQESTTNRVDPHLVSRIVGSYLQHHQVPVDQLAALIADVHRSLARAGQSVRQEEALVPAVSARRSVQRDYVVCLDCGYRGVILRRHIRIAHGLDPAAYRERWKLSADHPLIAPSHSERRSALAKQLRFGRKLRAAVDPPPASAATPGATKGRGRQRKQPSATA